MSPVFFQKLERSELMRKAGAALMEFFPENQ